MATDTCSNKNLKTRQDAIHTAGILRITFVKYVKLPDVEATIRNAQEYCNRKGKSEMSNSVYSGGAISGFLINVTFITLKVFTVLIIFPSYLVCLLGQAALNCLGTSNTKI